MPGRKLKNYDIYRQKIELYAEAMNIKLEFKEEPSDGIYLPTLRKIRIDDALEESTEIAVLLHELGHFLDDTFNINSHANKAYGNIYIDKATSRQKDIVIECEKSAWEYGRAIAKKLRIRLGLWYDLEAKQGIKDYREI